MHKKRDEAKNIILNQVSLVGEEKVTLNNSFGRVLASDIYAKFDIPEIDKSAVDGFALNINENGGTSSLKIVGESRAGFPFEGNIKSGEAISIMTGAVVPKSCDRVVRVEDVEVIDNYVIIKKTPKKGDLINFAGGEIKKNQKVVEKGTLLNYRVVALLANIGYFQIPVYSKVKIGIVITGDEVREPWVDSDKAGIKNSNFYTLKGLLEPFADIHYYGIIQDEPEKMLPIFEKALSENHILLSSGGVSKGKYDFTKDVASKLGLNIHITSTNIRPGRPLIFATKKEKMFFGLPGYPSALLVNSLEFLIPAVRKMAGLKEYKNRLIQAIAVDKLRAKKGRVDFIRVKLSYKNGKVYAYNSGSQQTSNFLTFAFSDGLAISDESRGTVDIDELVDIIFLERV